MPTDFVMVSTQRSGSTFLEELLSNGHDCYVFGELFNRNQPFYVPMRAIKRGYISVEDLTAFQLGTLMVKYGLYRMDQPGTEIALGAHLMWNQIADRLLEMTTARGMRVVFLERENLLAVYRSAKFARDVGLSHVRDQAGTPSDDRVTYDHEEFCRFTEKLGRFNRRRSDFCAQHPDATLTVTYAQLVADKLGTVNRIRGFLGLPETELVQSDLKKRQSGDPIDGFANPDDVRSGLCALGLDSFLEPEYVGS